MEHVASQRGNPWPAIVLAAFAAFTALPPALSAQTIRGRLLDAQNGQPIDLGLLVLFTADGDSIGLTVSNPDGGFSINAPEAGSYTLRASAWGYRDRQEGVFDLGDGGTIDIEFRIAPRALLLEEILVPIEGSVINDHRLVRNGFVRRFQQGFGDFITPRDLQRTPYRRTESLFYRMPGVYVIQSTRYYASGGRVLVRGPWGRCSPTVYVDGFRTTYSPSTGLTLSVITPIDWIDAVEVFVGPAEVPLEYPAGRECPGVILIWLKR